MTLYSATVTLILVMGTFSNIPMFITLLSPVEGRKRYLIIVRESLIAFAILTLFLFFGQPMLEAFHISQSALSIAGGVLLFLIALKMIFPEPENSTRRASGEPFIVPMAIPLIAGPSAIATVILFSSQYPNDTWLWFMALGIASAVSTSVLAGTHALRRYISPKGLVAIERLMGMLLTTIAVQMFLTGLEKFLRLPSNN